MFNIEKYKMDLDSAKIKIKSSISDGQMSNKELVECQNEIIKELLSQIKNAEEFIIETNKYMGDLIDVFSEQLKY